MSRISEDRGKVIVNINVKNVKVTINCQLRILLARDETYWHCKDKHRKILEICYKVLRINDDGDSYCENKITNVKLTLLINFQLKRVLGSW